MKIKHVDHIGINVNNLKAAAEFFIDLGFTMMGEAEMEGELLDEVTGLKDAKTELVMLKAPDSQVCLEIVKYYQPANTEDSTLKSPNAHGLEHLALEVEDLDDLVKALQAKGHKLVGSVQNYKNIWKICYIRGPEGIILELAEKLEK